MAVLPDCKNGILDTKLLFKKSKSWPDEIKESEMELITKMYKSKCSHTFPPRRLNYDGSKVIFPYEKLSEVYNLGKIEKKQIQEKT